MNDENTPRSDDSMDTDASYDDVVLDADDIVVDALRSTPHDLDELFATRAIGSALESLTAPTTTVRPLQSGSVQRRWAPIGAAVAAVLVLVVVGVISIRSDRGGGSFAADGDQSKSSATRSSETMTEDAVDSEYDTATEITGGNETSGSGDISTDSEASADAEADSMGAVPPVGPDPAYLGDFDDIDSLRSSIDSGNSSKWSNDRSGSDYEGVDGDDAVSDDPMTEAPNRDVLIDVNTCSRELAARGHQVYGWAMVADRPFVVVEDAASGRVQVFDAMTCTA